MMMNDDDDDDDDGHLSLILKADFLRFVQGLGSARLVTRKNDIPGS